MHENVPNNNEGEIDEDEDDENTDLTVSSPISYFFTNLFTAQSRS
jgi:hypothetical protein